MRLVSKQNRRPAAAALGVVTAATLAAAPPAAAQCDPAVLSHVGGVPNALAVRSNIGYVTYPGDLRIIDVTNPTAPALLGSVLIPGAAEQVDLGQTHLGIACGNAGLVIVDVSTPASPVMRSVVPMTDAEDVAVSNQKAFVVDWTDLKIVDISAPSSPVVYSVPQFPSFGFAQAVASSGDTLYLAGTSDVEILDTATPATPALLGTYSPSADPDQMIYRSGVLAIAGYEGVELVDVSNPAAPTFLSLLPADGTVRELAIEESGGTIMAYFENDWCELAAYDITNPAAPVLRSVLAECVSAIEANGTDVFIVTSTGINAVEYAVPTLPTVVHTAEREPTAPDGVGIVGQHVLVLDGDNLMTLDVAAPEAPAMAATFALPDIGHDLVVDGTTAYVAQIESPGSSGLLEIYDVSAPTAPVLLGSIATPSFLQEIVVEDGLLYGVTGAALQIIDVTDPAAPVLVSDLLVGSDDVVVADGYAFLSDFFLGISVVDARNPAAPQLVMTLPPRAGNYIDGMAIRDRSLAVAESDQLVDIYDVTDPANPLRTGGFQAFTFVTDLKFVDSLLLVAEGGDTLHFVDTVDPAAPALIGSTVVGGYLDEAAAAGTQLWSSGFGGLWGIDLPRQPRITTSPQDAAVCPGTDADFSVSAVSENGPTTYRWRRNGVNLVNGATATGATVSGAFSANLHITGPALGDLGNYDCVITNACGSVTSANALLSAALPPVVFQQPQDDAACAAGEATFTLTGIGTPPLDYRWERENPPGSGVFTPMSDVVAMRFTVSGATGRTLYISANPGQTLPSSLETSYRCIVTNQCDTVTTAAAALTLCTADLDCSDAVDVFDLLAYLDLWFPAAPAADIDGAPGIDVLDLLAYLDGWFAGC